MTTNASEKFPRERLLIQGGRVGLYLVVLLLGVISQIFQSGFLNWDLLKYFYLFVFLGFVIHGIPLFFIGTYYSKPRWLAASFVADVFLISGLAIKTELHQSLFLFMYLLTIILGALVFGRRGALLLALLSSIGFSLVNLMGPEMKSMSFLFLLILNNLAFFSVAWLGGYLAEQLNLLGERLQAQSLSLRTIQKLNELVIATIPSGLITTRLNGEILTANPGALALFRKANLAGENIFALEKSLIDLPQTGGTREIRLSSVVNDDVLLKINCIHQQSDELSEKTYLFVFEDLTQLRHLEFAVRQSEKMAAIGQLASGIAHEIRNPLAGISGSIELMSQQTNNEDDKKLIKIVLREIDRLNNLITEFLDFAKPEKIPQDPVDLNAVLLETLRLAEPQAPAKLVITSEWGELRGLTGSRDKLKQAFLNIVINAYQAMQNSERAELKISTSQQGAQITLRIKDSGPGMSEEVKKRIFEPFMTTKPKGTGLGLAITHKILESHRAQIFVESTVGLGTEFVLVFPTSA